MTTLITEQKLNPLSTCSTLKKTDNQLISLRGFFNHPNFELKREHVVDSLEGSYDGFLDETTESSILSNDTKSDEDSLTTEGSPIPSGSKDNSNNRFEICGHSNRHGKPCKRIGRCPFHAKDNIEYKGPPLMINQKKGSNPGNNSKVPYKTGWTPEEHVRFLKGIQLYGKGAWKDIATIVGTRTPTQIQVHAHRYFLRQKQGIKKINVVFMTFLLMI